MSFEAEVIPLFIGGVSIISIIELVVGFSFLKRKKARNLLIGHTISMAVAFIFLIRSMFANWLGVDFEYIIPSIYNSVNIATFGICWAISILFLLSLIIDLVTEG